MDLLDLLLHEHAEIRTWALAPRPWPVQQFEEFSWFVIQCHATHLEDEILFPLLRSRMAGRDEFLRSLSRIAADHRLLATLAGNTAKYGREGAGIYPRRVDDYFKLLQFHNDAEEEMVFTAWAELPAADREDASARAAESARRCASSGPYLRYSGLAERTLGYLGS
ncbi:MAG: hypothetical protein ACP5GT_04520 [Conexivisphaera sp.]